MSTENNPLTPEANTADNRIDLPEWARGLRGLEGWEFQPGHLESDDVCDVEIEERLVRESPCWMNFTEDFLIVTVSGRSPQERLTLANAIIAALKEGGEGS